MDKNIKKEALYLYVIQISNFIIPLIAFPYLTRALGVEGFGKLGFAQTMYFLFVFIIDFGFNLTGAKSISLYKDKRNNLNTLYTNIQSVKFFLFLILSLLVIPIVFMMGYKNIDSIIIGIALLASFSSFLIPNYIFNGLGINSVLAFTTVLIKSLFLIPVFFVVNTPEDILLAVVLQIMSGLVVGLTIQYIIHRRKIVKFKSKLIKKKLYIIETKKSFDNFIASFFTLGFTYLTPILIKVMLGDAALGLYAVVDRLVAAFRQLYAPITQAFFSKICIAYETKSKEYILMLKKISIIFLALGTLAFLGNLFLGNILLPIIFGKGYDVYYYLLIAIVIQVVVSFASILVNFVIIPSDNTFILKKIYFSAAIIYFPLCWFFVHKYQLKGVFLSMFVIELYVFVYLLKFLSGNCKPKLI